MTTYKTEHVGMSGHYSSSKANDTL